MVTKENVFNSKGWNLINKVSSIFSMHHIYRQNYSDLEQLLVKIHNDIFITTDVNQAIFVHLEQYIFNFLASASALTDLSRKTMNYYKGTDLYEKYQIMVKEAFDNDLSQFVRNLRNYQTHYQLVFPYTVKSLDDNKLWDVVLISKDLLKYPDQWNARAKKFINKNGEEVNVNKVFAEYNCLVDAFYMWLYAKLDEYHKYDIKERNYLVKQANLNICEFSFNPLGVSSEECEKIIKKIIGESLLLNKITNNQI